MQLVYDYFSVQTTGSTNFVVDPATVFTFSNKVNVAPRTLVTTNQITVSGIQESTLTTITEVVSIDPIPGNTLIVNGREVGFSYSVKNGDVVSVVVGAAPLDNTVKHFNVYIGNTHVTFDVTTGNVTPDPIFFNDLYETVPLVFTSSTIATVTGVSTGLAVVVSVNHGTVIINGSDTRLSTTLAYNGNAVQWNVLPTYSWGGTYTYYMSYGSQVVPITVHNQRLVGPVRNHPTNYYTSTVSNYVRWEPHSYVTTSTHAVIRPVHARVTPVSSSVSSHFRSFKKVPLPSFVKNTVRSRHELPRFSSTRNIHHTVEVPRDLPGTYVRNHAIHHVEAPLFNDIVIARVSTSFGIFDFQKSGQHSTKMVQPDVIRSNDVLSRKVWAQPYTTKPTTVTVTFGAIPTRIRQTTVDVQTPTPIKAVGSKSLRVFSSGTGEVSRHRQEVAQRVVEISSRVIKPAIRNAELYRFREMQMPMVTALYRFRETQVPMATAIRDSYGNGLRVTPALIPIRNSIKTLVTGSGVIRNSNIIDGLSGPINDLLYVHRFATQEEALADAANEGYPEATAVPWGDGSYIWITPYQHVATVLYGRDHGVIKLRLTGRVGG